MKEVLKIKFFCYLNTRDFLTEHSSRSVSHLTVYSHFKLFHVNIRELGRGGVEALIEYAFLLFVGIWWCFFLECPKNRTCGM